MKNIKLLKNIRYEDGLIGIAVSGGIDSMGALKFLLKYPKNNIKVFHFNHGTDFAKVGEEFVTKFCADNKLPLVIGRVQNEKDKRLSWEEYWRNERYAFLHAQDIDIITAHTLDDNVESWIFNCFHGKPGLIPFRNRNVIRPFMLTRKSVLERFAGDDYVQDESNFDTKYSRNLIRHNIVGEALKVNPGLHKVVYKMLMGTVNA